MFYTNLVKIFKFQPLFNTISRKGATMARLLICLVGFLLFAVENAYALQYYVEVQPIQVRQDDGSNAATMNLFEDETLKVWEQADIGIVFLDSNTY